MQGKQKEVIVSGYYWHYRIEVYGKGGNVRSGCWLKTCLIREYRAGRAAIYTEVKVGHSEQGPDIRPMRSKRNEYATPKR